MHRTARTRSRNITARYARGVPDGAEWTMIAAIKRTSFTAAMEGDSASVLEIEPRIGDAELTSKTMGCRAFDQNNLWFIVRRDFWVPHSRKSSSGIIRRVAANCRSASVIGIAVSTR